MEIINEDKKGKYGERRQKKMQFVDKSLEERLRIMEFEKYRTEERISQLQKHVRSIELRNFTHSFKGSSNPNYDSEGSSNLNYDSEEDWMDRSTNFGRSERQFR